MSEAALGTPHSAFSGACTNAAVLQKVRWRSAWSIGAASPWLSAECRVPNAALRAAIPCTVTLPDTSVTTLPLVESGLIIVGKASGRRAETAADCGFVLAAHCSFNGGMCIQ